ncbi:hypothetical protein [Corynebacterium variabile]|uniref:hypothetical protein n=1 Tax=Corynebacterium variabile TaxID=1727 RepID=UPI003FD36940
MMDHTTAETIARAVLARGKAALPARFPVVTTETVTVWADLFARYGVNYPTQVWPEAVDHYVAKMDDGDNQAGPRSILAAAREVIAHWETDPEKAVWLAEQRHGTLSRREATGALPVGTAPEILPDGRTAPNRAIDAPADTPSLGGLNAFRELRDEIGEKSIIRTVGKSTNTDGTVSPVAAAILRKKRDERDARKAERARKGTGPVELGGGAA